MLRILILISTLAATTWGGVWMLKSRAWQADLTTWMEDRRAEGWQADWGEVTVRGFPNRLDTTITDVALADTQAGWAWNAPFVQLFSLAYRPQEVIVALPNDTVLQTPQNRYRLHGDDIRASLSLDREADLALERLTAVLEGVGLARDGGNVLQDRLRQAGAQGHDGRGLVLQLIDHTLCDLGSNAGRCLDSGPISQGDRAADPCLYRI